MRKYCPKCSLYIPLYPEDGKCPSCEQHIDLPTLDELERIAAATPVPVPYGLVDWVAVFDSHRDLLYLTSVVIALERRRVEQRDPSDNPH